MAERNYENKACDLIAQLVSEGRIDEDFGAWLTAKVSGPITTRDEPPPPVDGPKG